VPVTLVVAVVNVQRIGQQTVKELVSQTMCTKHGLVMAIAMMVRTFPLITVAPNVLQVLPFG
jgi:hypothetical protein